jgi:integrase
MGYIAATISINPSMDGVTTKRCGISSRRGTHAKTRRAFLLLVSCPQHPRVACPGVDSIRTMADTLTLPQPAQTRKSTEHAKGPRQRRKAPRLLTEPQVEHLRRAVKKTSRNPHRDSTMILLAYRHGLRVGELTDLRWEDVHLDRAEIYVRRLKGSKSTMQHLQDEELRALRKLRRENTSSLPFVFISEQGGCLSTDTVEYMLRRAGQAAGLPHVHPHMLRHGCGYRLVNQGANTRTIQDYLGHRDMSATPRSTPRWTRAASAGWTPGGRQGSGFGPRFSPASSPKEKPRSGRGRTGESVNPVPISCKSFPITARSVATTVLGQECFGHPIACGLPNVPWISQVSQGLSSAAGVERRLQFTV